MKTVDIACWLLGFFLIGFVVGAKIAEQGPTPHQCVSICAEEFEKMGC